MAYVVSRPGGRWEIRESVATERGPRSRTLATFRRLAPEVVDRAASRASRPTSATEIRAAARRAGATNSVADAAARTLLTEIGLGRPPSPGLRRVLAGLLADPPQEDPDLGDAILWAAASPEERARALDGLLQLVDFLPVRHVRPLSFPPLLSRPDADGG
jgi:hypothetical protein